MDIAPQLYKASMMEVKRRFRAVDRVLAAKKPRTLNEEFDSEFMWLQIRKIIELVAFGGIASDEQRYAAIRAEAKDNPDYRLDWKVGKILRNLEKITPHFLPIPIGPLSRNEDETFHYAEGEERETLERFVAIYELAGQYLHAPNPFDFETLADFQHRIDTSRERIKREINYLKKVLWNHAKVGLSFDGEVDSPQVAASPSHAWIVHFGAADTEDVAIDFSVAT